MFLEFCGFYMYFVSIASLSWHIHYAQEYGSNYHSRWDPASLSQATKHTLYNAQEIFLIQYIAFTKCTSQVSHWYTIYCLIKRYFIAYILISTLKSLPLSLPHFTMFHGSATEHLDWVSAHFWCNVHMHINTIQDGSVRKKTTVMVKSLIELVQVMETEKLYSKFHIYPVISKTASSKENTGNTAVLSKRKFLPLFH